MPMTATMAPYTLFILDDDTPMNPREDHDCLGKMVCWHSRYSLGEKHDYDEPSDFLRNLLFSEYSSGHDRNNPVFAFLKSGKAKDARLEYNRSTREWELRENQHWSSDSDWYVSSSYAASLKDEVPDWFLDDCLSALTTGELFSLVEQMDGMVILPLYLYDHSGITMNTCGFSCPMPVLLVQKALKQNAPDTLEVLADSRVAVENITRLANSQGYQVTEIPEGINFKLTLKKSSL